MKDLIRALTRLYLAAVVFLVALVGALIAIAHFATHLPLVLVALVSCAAVWKWVHRDPW